MTELSKIITLEDLNKIARYIVKNEDIVYFFHEVFNNSIEFRTFLINQDTSAENRQMKRTIVDLILLLATAYYLRLKAHGYSVVDNQYWILVQFFSI